MTKTENRNVRIIPPAGMKIADIAEHFGMRADACGQVLRGVPKVNHERFIEIRQWVLDNGGR